MGTAKRVSVTRQSSDGAGRDRAFRATDEGGRRPFTVTACPSEPKERIDGRNSRP